MNGEVNDQNPSPGFVADLEEALRQGRRRSTLLADPRSLRQSFLVDRILHGDPYHSTYASARPSQLPRHEWIDFAEDPVFRSRVEELNEVGTPYVLIHLATYAELAERDEYGAAGERERELVESLGRVTSLEIEETLPHLNAAVQDLDSVPVSPEDMHPSLRGHQFYAEVVHEVPRRGGYVGPALRRAATEQ